MVRDYFYVSDLVDALIAGAQQELGLYRIFNIGGSTGITLLQLLGMVEKTVGKRAIVEYEPLRTFDAPHIILDTSLAAQELKWRPKVDVWKGLTKTWDWMTTVSR